MKHFTRSTRWLVAAGALLLLAACDGEADTPDAGSEPTPDAGPALDDAGPGAPDAGEPMAEPMYVLQSAVQTTDDRLSYFTVVRSLTEATEVEYDASIEVPGRARLYGGEGLGFFVVGDGEDVSLTRYDVAEDGTLAEGARLSFQALGVTSLGAQAVAFASPTLAYYKDPGQAQVIVWDPSAMEIVDTIELPASVLRDGYRTSYGDWAEDDGHVYFTVVHYSPTYDAVAPGTQLVRIDTATQEVTVLEDDRCRGLSDAAVVDGDIYYFSNVINAFGHAVSPGESGQANCMLRIRAGEDAFDADWVGGVTDRLPENTSATVVTATGDTLWAQVVDLAVAPTAPGTTYSEWYENGWRWHRLTLAGEDVATPVTEEAGAYSSFAIAQPDFFLLAVAEADYSSTTLVDVSGSTPSDGLTFAGFALDALRVR